MKKATLLVGVVFAAAFGVANAQEPIKLTGVQMDAVSAAGGAKFYTDIYRKYQSYQSVHNTHVSENVSVNLIVGNAADSDAQADAFGYNTFTYTGTGAQVVQGNHSQSYSKSVAATSGFYGHCGVCN